MNYEIGIRVTYRTTDGSERTVTITAKESERGTFLGTCNDEEGYPMEVWGYEADIVKVH